MAKCLAVLVVPALLAGLAIGFAGSRPVVADNDLHSHLKITSTAPCGSGSPFTCEVINNAIVVTIKAERQCPGGGDEVDTGTLTLTPSNPPAFAFTCSSCPHGFFNQVTACATLSGCASTDVLSWLVGVHVQAGGGGGPNCLFPGNPDEVTYSINSNDLGNGKRWVRTGDCSQTVTPKSQTYSATDLDASWDNATLCSDNGVSINLEYE